MKNQSRLIAALLTPGLLMAIGVGQAAAQDQNRERKLFTTYSLEETYLEDEGQVEELIGIQQKNTTIRRAFPPVLWNLPGSTQLLAQ